MPGSREPAPEKYEPRSGKYAPWIAVAIILALLAVSSTWRVEPLPEKSEREPDICEGLSDLQCLEAQAVRKRQLQHAEALQEAGIID